MTGPAGEPDKAWDDPAWAEPRDTPWRAGCRWLQARWRAERLHLLPGPHRPGADPQRLVASMLPEHVDWTANFITPAAARAAQGLSSTHAGGIVDEDRLRRNLLSSQPACLNLFAPLAEHPGTVAAWLRSAIPTLPDDLEVESVEFEWAPPSHEHFGGGSAFDAFVTYTSGHGRGVVGIETKYAEDLAEQAPRRIRDTYAAFTRDSGLWLSDAVPRLMDPRLRQLWLNTLLGQSLLLRGDGRFTHGAVLVLTCRDDVDALDATVDVASELADDHATGFDGLHWSSYEAVMAAAREDPALASFADEFTDRYLDFEPVSHKLHETDSRLHEHGPTADAAADLESAYTTLDAIYERTVGSDSIVASTATAPAPLWSTVELRVAAHRLGTATAALKGARIRASRATRS